MNLQNVCIIEYSELYCIFNNLREVVVNFNIGKLDFYLNNVNDYDRIS